MTDYNNMIPPKVRLSEYVYQIRKRKESPYNVTLVNGTPIDPMSILNAIYVLGQSNWDILAVRLTEEIIEKEQELSAHRMRNLAQEVIFKENLPGQMATVDSEDLNPFEISEKSKRCGIS